MSNDASYQLLELNIISAQDLSSVSRSMRTYAVAWIDPDRKLSTKVDSDGGNNPTWNDKFAFRVDHHFLYNEDSVITIDIYALHWFKDIHVGTVHVLSTDLFPPPTHTQKNTYKSTGMRFMGLQVQRPSGRPKGILNIGAAIIDASLRSMPLCTDGYIHHDLNNPTHQPKPELRRIKSDSSSMIGSEADYQPNKTKWEKASSQDTPSTISGSDLNPTPKWGKFGRKNSKKSKNNLNARLSLDYQLKSTPNQHFPNATPKRDFPNATPKRDFPNATPKRDFQLKSTPKREFPNSTPMREFPNSTPKREFPNSTPKREFQIKSTPKREFPNSTPKREFQVMSTPNREFPNNTSKQEFQVKSTPMREFPNSTPKRDFPNATPKRDFPNATPKRDFPNATPKRDFPNATPKRDFPNATPKRDFPNATPKREFEVKSTTKPEFPNSTPLQEFEVKPTPKREFENSPGRNYKKGGNVKATPLHAFAVKKAALEYGTPFRGKMGGGPIMMTNSELGPSASEVAAILAREELNDEEEDSTVEGWSLDESSQHKTERWQTEYDGSDRTSSKNGKHSRKQPDAGNGLFSCFGVVCGVECSIVCGGGAAATSKNNKKNRRRRRRGVQSLDNESFV